MKVATIVGTRPELIRLSLIIKKMDKFFDHVLIHTGQNYNYELNEIFFKDLDIRKPDYFLETARDSLGKTLGEILIRSEEAFNKIKPNAVLVLGDTNSALTTIIARRMHIPIFHMEAGNRCFDLNVPEETNRKIVDHVSDINIVYTEHARRNLIREGFAPNRVYLSGSPMNEVLTHFSDKISASAILSELKLSSNKYFLVSAHREENVDCSENLLSLVRLLNTLAEKYQLPVIVSTHPRTENRLKKLNAVTIDERVQYLKPFGFFDYVQLQKNALCVVSDSGTISEEASILNFPAVTIRNSMERPEAMDAGVIILTGLSNDVILSSIDLAINTRLSINSIPLEYRVDNVSDRVVRLIMGLTGLIHRWDGIQKNDLTLEK